MNLHPSASMALVGALALTLTACGGGDDGTASATSAATEADTATTLAIVPLFDNSGHPSAAATAAQPANPAGRTQAGLYSSPAQYQWEALVNSPYTVLVDLDAAGSAETAIHGAIAARDLNFPDPSKLAWFVKSSDLRAGARLADALTGLGLDQVFLIVAAADVAR